MSPPIFLGSLLGVSLIVVPLWPTIMRPFRRFNETAGAWLHNIIYAQPFSHLLILEKARDNKVRTFRLLFGRKTWAIILLHEKPKGE